MKNSKLIALLSAGALVLSSFSGLAVSGNSALAAGSRARQRYSDGYFQAIVTNKSVDAVDEHDTDSIGVNRLMKSLPTGANAADKDYTGFLQADYDKALKYEYNVPYVADTGYNKDLPAADQAIANGAYHYSMDRSGQIINNEIYAEWQKGYVGDVNITTYLTDEFDDESEPTVDGGDDFIQLQTGADDPAGKNAPAYPAVFAALVRDKGQGVEAPDVLRRVAVGNFAGWDGHGVALWGVADKFEDGAFTSETDNADTAAIIETDKITLALDAKVGHYTKWDGWIFVGDSGSDDDGEYLPVHIAYPGAVQAKSEYGFTVLYGGEPSAFAVDDVMVNDLPHDQWIWVIKDDNTKSFTLENNQDYTSTTGNEQVKVYATENATKGATATLELYNSRLSDDCFVYSYQLQIASPNFYTEVYLRADKDIDGNGVNYANGTYTTANNKAEIRATATMLVNEGAADIAQPAVRWTWTAKEKNDKVRVTTSGITNNIATFEVDNMDTVQSVTYIVRAYSVNQTGQGQGQFDESNNGTLERMYGERTITVVFDKDYVETITTDALPVGTGFTVEDGYYVVTSDTEVEFAKYVGVATTYAVPAQVTFGNYTYNVTSAGKKAFASKTQLKEVTLPASITKINNGLFKNCKKLTSVTFLGAITEPAKNVFLKAGAKNGKKLKVSLAAGTSDETIKAMKKSNKNAKIK